jgi:hypothetical protein
MGMFFFIFEFVRRIYESILCSVSAFDNKNVLLSAYYQRILFVEREGGGEGEYLYNKIFTLVILCVFINLYYTALAVSV